MTTGAATAVKERTLEGFGARLAELRQEKGWTQAELGRAVGVSNRVIHYYEQESAQPPGALLIDLAKALEVSADELLGLKAKRLATSPKTARLLKRLRRVEELPAADQRAVLKFVDALVSTRNGHQRNARRRATAK